MIQQSPDETIKKIDTGFPAIAHAAIEKARQTKTKLVVLRDGKIVEIDPDEVEPDERPA
ncbi:MAG: hypothetical protein RBT70_09625 [Alphaproteobacteria bacterium]|jgi:hypothetical protein|nr:hypothetical protein [Alphaproteobacteria bacterium]